MESRSASRVAVSRAREALHSSVGTLRSALPITALMLLSAWAWELLVPWIGWIYLALAAVGFLLCLTALATLRGPAAIEEGEPRRLARVWLVLTSLWSVGLLCASPWPGVFEQNWAFIFGLTSPVIAGAWSYVLAKLALNRRRAFAGSEPGGPRRLAVIWLTAAMQFSSVMAVFSAREALGRPRGFLWVLAQTVPWIAGLFFVTRVFLRELPTKTAEEETGGPRALAIVALRTLSATAAVLLCASSRWFDGAPPFQALILAGLALLGGFHLALEVVTRELPRGARTLRLGSLAIVLATVSVALVLSGLPRRATFELYRSSFEACLSEEREGPQRIGPWRVHRAVDPRGGVFFYTWSGQKDSDCFLTYGFAHRPNSEGTPFGDRVLEFQPLGGDWYEFQACSP